MLASRIATMRCGALSAQSGHEPPIMVATSWVVSDRLLAQELALTPLTELVTTNAKAARVRTTLACILAGVEGCCLLAMCRPA